ncbi:MAG: hypothetical protein J6V91_00655 [Kiritimatiellae bacterium]|jgi:hypothetical protein|nr:hypothetical protein [Kiritimatiellia bacterium]
MNLSAEQEALVRQWVAEGASLSDVQKNIRSEFGLHPTFFDVRMLVMNLGATLKDKEVQVAADDVTKAKLPPKPGAAAPQAPGSVTVSVDTLQVIPGAIISGSVVFSDGNKARWYFDQMGRFGFEPELPGYTPPEGDMQSFKVQLSQELRQRGL